MHLIGQKIFCHPTYAYFSCDRDLCRAMLQIYLGSGHLPQLSAKFEPWMKHLSVLGMKQQYCYIFKLILIRGITLFSTGISSQIPCFIDGLLLYVAYLSSGFGNSKMVTECEPKPISMNFGSPKRGEGGFMCGRHGAGLDWPEEKIHF